MDVIEARTDQTFDHHIQWRLRNWTTSENEREVFRRVTIEEGGEDTNTVDIWVMRGKNTIAALANNTFHVWSEHDLDSIDWNNGLFR